jgi:hypothetical protein
VPGAGGQGWAGARRLKSPVTCGGSCSMYWRPGMSCYGGGRQLLCTGWCCRLHRARQCPLHAHAGRW